MQCSLANHQSQSSSSSKSNDIESKMHEEKNSKSKRISRSVSSSSSTRFSIYATCSLPISIDNGVKVPLRVYAGCLRSDIQYKTVGVSHGTTSGQVINLILNKCKLRYKDPKLFILTLELKIRVANGPDVEASIPLEETAYPLKLQECYPRGQAKFSLKLDSEGCRLVKVYDETGLAGWQYKSLMITEKTTAGELIDILFRYATSAVNNNNIMHLNPSASYNNLSKNNLDGSSSSINNNYMLSLEINQTWRQELKSNELVVPMQTILTNQFGPTKLVLLSLHPHNPNNNQGNKSSQSLLTLYNPHGTQLNVFTLPSLPASPCPSSSSSRNSTISLYENVINNNSITSTGSCTAPEEQQIENNNNQCKKCNTEYNNYWRRRRCHSLSSSSGGSSSITTTNGRQDHSSVIDAVMSRRNDELHEESNLINGFNRFGINRNSNNNNANNNISRRLINNSNNNSLRYEFFV